MATLCLTECLLLTGAMKIWPQQESVDFEKQMSVFHELRETIWFWGGQAVLPVRPNSQGKKEPDACSRDCSY